MINLLCLLCSLCIQFSALGLPYDVPNFDDMSLIKDYLLSSQNVPNSFIWFADTPNAPYIVLRLSLQNDGSCIYNIGFPVSSFDTSVTSSAVVSNGEFVNNNDFYRGVITFTGWDFAQFVVSSDHTTCSLNGGYNQTRYYQTNFLIPSDNYLGNVVYQRVVGANAYSFYDNNGNLIFLNESALLPTFPGIGSLSPTGHSSDHSPLESMENFSWSAHSSSSNQSGHNTHVRPSAATPDFTNATQNLLGQVVDNTNSIIENTNNLGGALETINGNIINGASAIFNAVSQLNNNFISAYVYDEDKVDEALQNSSMLLFAQTSEDLTETIINESQVLLDAVHDMEEKQDLILYLDLTKWKVPVYSSSTGVNTSYVRPYNEVVEIDFTFLKETKSIWQPILLGVLYFALFISIYFDLPNILRGVNA